MMKPIGHSFVSEPYKLQIRLYLDCSAKGQPRRRNFILYYYITEERKGIGKGQPHQGQTILQKKETKRNQMETGALLILSNK